jgi:hypothetical protein
MLLTPEECEELRASHLGPLFKIAFYRLILDEAHAIKNHESQRRITIMNSVRSYAGGNTNNCHTSGMKACVELTAKYRWALSGTPVHNRMTGRCQRKLAAPPCSKCLLTPPQEIYPYMRFLRAPQSSTLGEFMAKYLPRGKVGVRSCVG